MSNDFQTYWDLEPKTRAALSESDVQRYVDAELMLKGVLKVEPLELDPEPDEPELAKQTVYRLEGFTDVAFRSADAAKAFAALSPLKLDRKYLNGNWSRSVPFLNADVNLRLDATEASTADDVLLATKDLERHAALKEANEKKRNAYSAALKTQNDALAGMWSDWHDQRGLAARHRRVVDTYEAYCKTAGGNTTVAAKFLQKVFSVEQIQDANEWFGCAIETEFAEAAPAEAAPEKPADDIAF
jgi:hypothetical protein